MALHPGLASASADSAPGSETVRQDVMGVEGKTYATHDVVERTGLSGALLRTWEERYGFPSPIRTSSGRRRYTEADVAALLEVKRRRDSGVRLASAIAEVSRSTATSARSLFVHARTHCPHATVHRLSKKMVLALTHAIEDECHASARSAVLFGLFQVEANYAAAQSRWEELAKSARAAVVFADFDSDQGGSVLPGGALRVPVPRFSPLLAEWAVVVDAVDMPVALVAREALQSPRSSSTGEEFDALWTLDPAEVRDVARHCAHLAASGGVEMPATAHDALDQPAPSAQAVGAPGDAATALFGRVLAYAGTAD